MDIRNRGMLADSELVKPYTRRPHRKTKTGCLSCKRRKIKCDESRPECENCVKHSLVCEYALKKQIGSPGHLLLSSSGCSELNLLDLELLHYFCTETSLTYHHNPTARRVMSINVPQLGFSHDFVMHGILALAALHIAKMQPERRDMCVAHAIHHHESGLQKASVVLPAIDDENASALYIFTVLTFLYTVSRPTLDQSDNHILVGETGIAEWIILSRQSYSIVRMAFSTLEAGPLAPIFSNGARRVKLQEAQMGNSAGNNYLREAAILIDQNTSDPSDKEAYAETINQLAKVYSVVEGLVKEDLELETSDIFVWPYKVTDKYLDFLQQGTQEALVILAFFAVLPTRYKDNWFLEDFGIHLISRIYPLIDESHLPWIQWPLQEIGWKPEKAQVYSIYSTPLS